MAICSISEFLQNLRRDALRRDEVGLTDGQLLEAYIRSREEAAFAALLRRHGPMVWGVCCRTLGNTGDAEDAFQATFLVLVRKAASIVPREQIANWLYGVARQTAVKARAMAVKRKTREKQVKDMPEPAVAEQNGRDDLLPLLDQELGRLPDKYRMAIVLCDLEGKSYKDAARQLGCPEGTLAARLARGRTMLAKRLARHGQTVTGTALVMVLAQSASADVPASVVSSTINAASLFAVGQTAATGAISAKVAVLTEGVLRTMLLTKLKIAMAVVLGAAVAGVGIGRCFSPLERADSISERQERKEQNAATPPSKKSITDKEKLQGTWKVVVDQAEKQKQRFAVEEYKSSKFVVDGDEFVWKLKSKTVKGKMYLDEKAKTFTLVYHGDGLEGEYQIESDTVSFLGKTLYVKNKVLPSSPPNPIVLQREPSSEKNGKQKATAHHSDGPEAKGVKRSVLNTSTEDVAKKDQQELRGIWEVVSIMHDGKAVEKIFYDGQVWVFDGNRIRGISPTSYTLDPSQTPKSINMTYKSRIGNNKYGPEVTDPGIYELKGDELRIAVRKSEHGRPRSFESTEDNHTIVTTLKRVRLGN